MTISFTAKNVVGTNCRVILGADGGDDKSCRFNKDQTASCSVSNVPENSRQNPVEVAITMDAIPSDIVFNSSREVVTLIAAFAASLEPMASGIKSTDVATTARKRWEKAKATALSTLVSAHEEAWAELWKSQVEIGGNISATTYLRSSYYYILSSVREDWHYGSSPGGLPSTSYHGHVFWDEEVIGISVIYNE